MASKAVVIMPLYIYPISEDTWQPLYASIKKHANLEFLVVVNPNSGPGHDEYPGHDYLREIPKLNALPNVTTVGYLSTDWCRRPLSQACRDIDIYANWGRTKGDQGVYIEGIYVDETPNHVSDHTGNYLEVLRLFIKGARGIRGDRLVVHNPGTPPEGHLSLFGNPDLVCVCEVSHATYLDAGVQQRMADYALKRDQTVFQVAAVPRWASSTSVPAASRPAAAAAEDSETASIEVACNDDGSTTTVDKGPTASSPTKDGMKAVVEDLCNRGRYVFATSLTDNFYESFGPCWDDFVGAVASYSRKT